MVFQLWSKEVVAKAQVNSCWSCGKSLIRLAVDGRRARSKTSLSNEEMNNNGIAHEENRKFGALTRPLVARMSEGREQRTSASGQRV